MYGIYVNVYKTSAKGISEDCKPLSQKGRQALHFCEGSLAGFTKAWDRQTEGIAKGTVGCGDGGFERNRQYSCSNTTGSFFEGQIQKSCAVSGLQYGKMGRAPGTGAMQGGRASWLCV